MAVRIDAPLLLAMQIEEDLRLFAQFTSAGAIPPDGMHEAQEPLWKLAAHARDAGMRGVGIEISEAAAELARVFHDNVEKALRPRSTA